MDKIVEICELINFIINKELNIGKITLIIFNSTKNKFYYNYKNTVQL